MNLDPRLLRWARKSRLALVLTIMLGIAGGVLTVLQAGCLSQVINQVFLGDKSLDQVSGLLVVMLGVILLRAGMVWGREVSAKAIAIRIKTTVRGMLYRHLLKLGPTYSRGEQVGELKSVMVEGIEALDNYYSQYLPQLILAVVVPLVFLGFIFPLDPLTGVILLLTAPLIPLFMFLIGNMAQAQTLRQWKALSRMSAYFLDVLQGLTTLKMLGRSKAQVGVIEQVSDRYRRVTMSVLRITFLSALVLELVATLATAVVAVEIGLRLLAGRLAFDQALFLLLLAPEFYLPLRMLGARFHAGLAGATAAVRIFEILETTDDGGQITDDGLLTPEDEGQAVADRKRLSFSELRLKEISFTYGDGRQALKNVSFEIKPGQRIVLVGRSGSGKSTVADLLLRFIRPTSGSILVDGKNLEASPLSEWRSMVAWVPQEPYLFHGTIVDNIRLGQPGAGLAEVINAAQQAHAHGFIEELPHGYGTVIGERAMRLSAGQAQRIALARAFLKDSPILILDEPTANLDPGTEAIILEAMNKLLVGRTALLIAHRLNTAKEAEQILVFERGCIVERGTHSSLIRREGLYRQMVASSIGMDSKEDKPTQVGNQRPIPAMPESSSQSLREVNPSLSPESSLSRSHAYAFTDMFTYDGGLSPHVSRANVVRRLLKLITPYKLRVVVPVLAGFATIISGIGLLATSAYLISAAALQPSIAELQVAIVGVRFFGISRGLFRYLERYTSHQVTFRLLAGLRVWFYSALEPLAPARLLHYRSGDLLARIQDDIESLQNFYVRVLAPPLVAVLVAIVTGIFLARFDASFAVTLLLFLILVGAGVPYLVHKSSRKPGRVMIKRRAALNAALVEGITGMADLLSFGREEDHMGRVNLLSRELGKAQMSMARIYGAQNGFSLLLANLCMWVVLVLAIPLVNEGQLAGVYLAVVVLTALTSFEAVFPLPVSAQHLESNLTAAERLYDVVDAGAEVKEPHKPAPVPRELNVKVENLYFRYPSSLYERFYDSREKYTPAPEFVLQDVSFFIPDGCTMAIVGASGAGKSTLVSLLLRFWEFQRGQIKIGGQDLHRLNSYDLRDQIAVVSQDSYLFNATVRENLLIARPGATEAEIIQAAQQAKIHDFIKHLPAGYDTHIGDRGMQLSGGERQRLLVTRALLKDAPLLLLDEATANLDAITERQLMTNIHALMKGRTMLIVTHRLVGLEGVDEILVLHRGRVVERGQHRELLKRGGYYWKMWTLQQGVFRDII